MEDGVKLAVVWASALVIIIVAMLVFITPYSAGRTHIKINADNETIQKWIDMDIELVLRTNPRADPE